MRVGHLVLELDSLVKFVEDGGLESLDNAGLVGFLQGFERARNRLALVDHQNVKDAQRRDLAKELGQSSLVRAFAATLRLSIGEAGRRVRAADALAERMAMSGEPIGPARPHLAATQRDGEVSPEQVDVVERALAKVDRVGFDPDAVDRGEELLAGSATLPTARPAALLHHAVDQGRWLAGEFRLTAEAGVKLQTVLGPLAKPKVDGAEPDQRHHGQRMHDALETVCDRLLRSDSLSDSGGTPATVIVTIDLQDLLAKTGYAVTGDGTLIPTRSALALADQAEMYGAAVTNSGVPLRLGRTRRIASAGQTAALIARDRGGSFPRLRHRPRMVRTPPRHRVG